MITINTNFKEANSILDSLNRGTRNFKKPLKEISKMQLKEIDEAFNVNGRNIISRRWEKLKPATTRQKIKLGLNKGILQRSGKLRKSFKKLLLKNDKLIIGSNVKYFKYHQKGTGKIPQRQILGHGNVMIKRTKILLNKYLLTLIKEGMI